MLHKNSHPRPVLVARVHARTHDARTRRSTYVRTGPDTFSRQVLSLLPSLSPSLSLFLPPVFRALLSLALPHSCHAARISDNRVGLREKAPCRSRWPPRSSRILPPSARPSHRCLFFSPSASLPRLSRFRLSCGGHGVSTARAEYRWLPRVTSRRCRRR